MFNIKKLMTLLWIRITEVKTKIMMKLRRVHKVFSHHTNLTRPSQTKPPDWFCSIAVDPPLTCGHNIKFWHCTISLKYTTYFQLSSLLLPMSHKSRLYTLLIQYQIHQTSVTGLQDSEWYYNEKTTWMTLVYAELKLQKRSTIILLL